MLYVGVMSGTSCDGIDVVVTDFSDLNATDIKVIAAQTTEYPDAIRKLLLDVIADVPTPISVISQLDAQLGHLYAETIMGLLKTHSIKNTEVKAIGLHGQTVYHQPPTSYSQPEFTNTIQLGSAAITAQQTGITTIANFRQMDVAYGGQGAPLAPVLHQHLFSSPKQTVAVLNLGGIANITLLSGDKVVGFDTGPASCLMDEYIQSQQQKFYDEAGQWANQGQVDTGLLQDFLSDEYFSLAYPKSTGREYFNFSWLNRYVASHDIEPVNIQRTLLQLTVESVAVALQQTECAVDQMVVCGGGVHNDFLMQQLQQRFEFNVNSSSKLGFDPDHVEAVLMAWMAQQNTENSKLDLSEITGCQSAHIYGIQFKP